ncbi:hypothetical protein [Nonomuraea typhae]|nr:hypothetical protein [Nonomuraea typhae]
MVGQRRASARSDRPQGRNRSILRTGLQTLLATLAMVVVSPFAGQFAAR